MHSYIPIHAFVVNIISPSEDFANLLHVCALLGLRKFCAGVNSPSSNSAAAPCEIPRRYVVTHNPDFRTTEHSASLLMGTLISSGHPKCEDYIEGRAVSDAKAYLYRTGVTKLIACNLQIFQ